MPHYFDENQDSELRLREIKQVLRGEQYTFLSGSGVFSGREVDKGTKLLANKSFVQDGWDVLDLGCGYGVVGIVIAKEFPECKVTLTDINKRAIILTKMNIEQYELKNCTVKSGDMYKPVKDKKFDTIIVNPPYVAGRKVVFEMLTQAKDHLKKNGLLQVVFRHQKGGKAVMKKMEEIFGNVKDTAKQSGYRIYVSALV